MESMYYKDKILELGGDIADCTMKVCEKGTCHECPSMCDMGLVI